MSDEMRCNSCGKIMVDCGGLVKTCAPPIICTNWKCYGCGWQTTTEVQQPTDEERWRQLNSAETENE